VECLLFAVLVIKVYVYIFLAKAPGQIRSRGLQTHFHPRISEGQEDSVLQNGDAGAGLVEVVHLRQLSAWRSIGIREVINSLP
jgi:hypothetical protein